MKFRQAVEDYSGKLTGSDRVLISLVLGDPLKVAFQSANELANRANVHSSTVVRLANKLGFDGFPGLKRALHQEARTAFDPSDRIRRRLNKADESSSLSMLIQRETRAIEAIRETLSQQEIDAAANILQAKQIYLVGAGAAPLVYT